MIIKKLTTELFLGNVLISTGFFQIFIHTIRITERFYFTESLFPISVLQRWQMNKPIKSTLTLTGLTSHDKVKCSHMMFFYFYWFIFFCFFNCNFRNHSGFWWHAFTCAEFGLLLPVCTCRCSDRLLLLLRCLPISSIPSDSSMCSSALAAPFRFSQLSLSSAPVRAQQNVLKTKLIRKYAKELLFNLSLRHRDLIDAQTSIVVFKAI